MNKVITHKNIAIPILNQGKQQLNSDKYLDQTRISQIFQERVGSSVFYIKIGDIINLNVFWNNEPLGIIHCDSIFDLSLKLCKYEKKNIDSKALVFASQEPPFTQSCFQILSYEATDLSNVKNLFESDLTYGQEICLCHYYSKQIITIDPSKQVIQLSKEGNKNSCIQVLPFDDNKKIGDKICYQDRILISMKSSPGCYMSVNAKEENNILGTEVNASVLAVPFKLNKINQEAIADLLEIGNYIFLKQFNNKGYLQVQKQNTNKSEIESKIENPTNKSNQQGQNQFQLVSLNQIDVLDVFEIVLDNNPSLDNHQNLWQIESNPNSTTQNLYSIKHVYTGLYLHCNQESFELKLALSKFHSLFQLRLDDDQFLLIYSCISSSQNLSDIQKINLQNLQFQIIKSSKKEFNDQTQNINILLQSFQKIQFILQDQGDELSLKQFSDMIEDFSQNVERMKKLLHQYKVEFFELIMANDVFILSCLILRNIFAFQFVPQIFEQEIQNQNQMQLIKEKLKLNQTFFSIFQDPDYFFIQELRAYLVQLYLGNQYFVVFQFEQLMKQDYVAAQDLMDQVHLYSIELANAFFEIFQQMIEESLELQNQVIPVVVKLLNNTEESLLSSFFSHNIRMLLQPINRINKNNDFSCIIELIVLECKKQFLENFQKNNGDSCVAGIFRIMKSLAKLKPYHQLSSNQFNVCQEFIQFATPLMKREDKTGLRDQILDILQKFVSRNQVNQIIVCKNSEFLITLNNSFIQQQGSIQYQFLHLLLSLCDLPDSKFQAEKLIECINLTKLVESIKDYYEESMSNKKECFLVKRIFNDFNQYMHEYEKKFEKGSIAVIIFFILYDNLSNGRKFIELKKIKQKYKQFYEDYVKILSNEDHFLYFRRKIGRVQISNEKQNLEYYYFEKPSQSNYLPDKLKKSILIKLYSSNFEQRKKNLLLHAEYYSFIMEKYEYLQSFTLLRFGIQLKQKTPILTHFASLIAAIILLLQLEEFHSYSSILNVITTLVLIINISALIFSMIESSVENLASNMFNLEQRELFINLKNQFGITTWIEDKIFICIKEDRTKTMFSFLSIIFNLESIQYIIIITLIRYCYSKPYLYVVLLMDIILLSEDLQNIIKCITINGKNIILLSYIALIVLLLFSIIAYAEFDDMFNEDQGIYAQTLLQAFTTIINFGLRSGGGLGDILNAYPNPNSNPEIYWSRYIYDVAFFIIFNMLFFQMLFGIILNTFGELRQQKQKLEEEVQNTCYICNVKKEESITISNYDSRFSQDFWQIHLKIEHNVCNMLFFIIFIKNIKKPNELELYLSNCIEKLETKFFPTDENILRPDYFRM